MIKKLFLNIHPFVFMLVSILIIYFQTIWESEPTEIFRPFLVLSLILLSLFPLMIKLGGSWERGGILMTMLVFAFLFQPRYFVFISLSSFLVILALFIFYKISKRRFLVSHVSISLNLVGFVILALEISTFFTALKSLPLSYFIAMKARSSSGVIYLSRTIPEPMPDIYYLVLDAYPRTDILQEIYQYDNSEFVEYLERIGFIVPKNIYVNYPRTALSISSTLDMQYWDTISPNMQDVIFWWPAKPIIRSSRVRETLEAIGYTSVTFASDWDITDDPTADIYYKPFAVRLTGYENRIATTTPLKTLMPVLHNVVPTMSNEVHRQYIYNILDNLKTVPKIDGPKFVFAHVLAPHPPFVFDENGNPIDSDDGFTFAPRLSVDEQRDGYIAHIEFLNDYLRTIVDTIIKDSKVPPIIILQADHGPGLYYSFSEPEKSCLRERFAVFGAYYLPEREKDVIPSSITSVNLFRIVFNEYFEAELPLLENRHYATVDHNLFAGMKDVTDLVGNACDIK